MLKVLLSVSFVSCALVFTSVASSQAASIVPLTCSQAGAVGTKLKPCCSQAEVVAAKELADKVKVLGQTDAAAALKVAEEVASSKSKCFQTAFGGELDGTGTASIGGPGAPTPGGNPGGDPGGPTGLGGGNGCVNAQGTCPASQG